MPLQPGVKLGPYEILAPLGAGGMGEVYKAKDTRLGRFVAIKVLPEHLSKSADALARFEREAKAVAALDHPNILAIHDLGQESATHYAVMELLEGESLRTRLAQGPLTPKKATELAVQMARGLAAAHAKGVVHRDLKPDNIWITKDGRLKLLDFGLAKQVAPLSQASGSLTPTESLSAFGGPRTEGGMILGTLGYMSPEQVRGDAVDARSDIFSFGAVLFEMLSGRKAFARNSASDTLAAILRDDPTEPEATESRPFPPGLLRVVEHCLEKDPAHRFHDAEDLAFALESALGNSSGPTSLPPTPHARDRRWLPAALLILVGGGLGWGVSWLLRPAPEAPSKPVAIRVLTYSGKDSSPAVSPDGKTLAFASNRDGTARIWLKQFQGGGEVAISAGSDDFPRFSPDGASLLFVRLEKGSTSLYRMSVLGTDPRKLVDDAVFGDWSPDGRQIAFVRPSREGARLSTSLCLATAEGGGERELTRFPDQAMGQPRWSPDGRFILLTTDQGTQGGAFGKVILVDAKSGAVKQLKIGEGVGLLSSTAWVSNSAFIFAQSESVAGNVSESSAVIYREDITTGELRPLFWAPSNAFTLDLLPGGRVVMDGLQGRESLREISLDGKTAPRWLTQGSSNDRQPVFSPDGEWVAFSSNRSGNLDLWMASTRSGAVRSLTDDAAEDWDPGFTPDGKHILWSSNRGGPFEVWMASTDGGSPRQVSHDGKDAENPTMTRDGAWVVYASTNAKAPGVWKIHPDGSGATLLTPGTALALPEVSPDGQFVAFVDQSDPNSQHLRVIRIADGANVFETKVPQVRKRIGALGRSRWTPDGHHLLFLGQDAQGLNGIYIQDFEPEKDTTATRKPLAGFDPDRVTESLGLSPDGKRLVIAQYDNQFNILLADGVPGLRKEHR